MQVSPTPGTRGALPPPANVTPTPKKLTIRGLQIRRKGFKITDYNIQATALNEAMSFMGMDFWSYSWGDRRRYRWSASLLQAVRNACGYNVSYHTLKRWISYYHKYGEVPAKSKRHRPTIKGIRTTKCYHFQLKHLRALQEIIEEQPQLYLDEIQVELFSKTGRLWSTSTIWSKLHTLGYSLKKAVFRAKQQQEQEVNDYMIRLNDRVMHPRQVLFIDETARGALASRRGRAWSLVGITPIVDAPMVREFDKRYTLIAACNWDGFIIPACNIVEREQGKTDNNPERGTVDADRFEEYLREFIVPVLGKAVNEEANSIVVMDNASIHNSEKVRDIIEETGAFLIYTAPYSPEYNPIEYMFGEYKKALKRLSHDGSRNWLDVHHEALHSVTPSMAKEFYKHCEVPMIKEWIEEQARSPPNALFPEPFNSLIDTFLDLL
jgi:transposase